MENPHLENFLDPPRNNGVEESLENDKLLTGRRAATCGGANSSFSLQTWKVKQQWSKCIKSWKARRACSLILVSGNCLCWRSLSVLYPSKSRLGVCYSHSHAAVCSYQQFTSKPGSVRTESQPSARNIKTVEAKTVHWLCVTFFFVSLPIPSTFPLHPSREGSLQLFLLAASSLRLFSWALYTLHSSAPWYGYSLALFCFSDLWLTTAQTPQLISFWHSFRSL